MRKYRIKELNGKFTIEILTKCGKWKSVDYAGDRIYWFWEGTVSKATFTSLESAKEQIGKWLEKPKYHPYP